MSLFNTKKQGSQNQQKDNPIEQIKQILQHYDLQGIVFISEKKEKCQACYFAGGQVEEIAYEIFRAMILNTNYEKIISLAVDKFNEFQKYAKSNTEENSRSSEE